jgi:hypothetical protein
MSFRLFQTGLLSAGLLLAVFAGRPALAQTMHPNSVALPTVTQYNDRGSFTAASSGLTTLDFGATTPINTTGVDYSTAAGLTMNGVNFVGQDDAGHYRLGTTAPAFYPLYQGFDGNPTVLQAGGNAPFNTITTTITLPAGTTAVGVDSYTLRLGDYYSNTVEPVDFVLFSNGVQIDAATIQTFEKPNLAFVGFVSPVPITSIQVTGENNSINNLSTFAFGSSAALPKPPPVNNGPKLTVTAQASVPDSNGRFTVAVFVTNNGSANADMLTLIGATFNSAVPAPVPPSADPIPTTPDLLSPGHTQIESFSYSPPLGTTHGVYQVSGTYVDASTGFSGTFSATFRRLTVPQQTN